MRAFVPDRSVYKALVREAMRAADRRPEFSICLVSRRTGRVIQSFKSQHDSQDPAGKRR